MGEAKGKPMIPSEKAAEKLREALLDRVSNIGLGFRVYSHPDSSGNSRLALKLDKNTPQDVIISRHGVRLYLDPLHFKQLINMELDYDESLTGGFILKQRE